MNDLKRHIETSVSNQDPQATWFSIISTFHEINSQMDKWALDIGAQAYVLESSRHQSFFNVQGAVAKISDKMDDNFKAIRTVIDKV